MVSKARLDLPEPDSPVMTTSESRGSLRCRSLRLCSRAPDTTISPLEFTRITSVEPNADRTYVRFPQIAGFGTRVAWDALRLHDSVRLGCRCQPGLLRAGARPAAPLSARERAIRGAGD